LLEGHRRFDAYDMPSITKLRYAQKFPSSCENIYKKQFHAFSIVLARGPLFSLVALPN
jgi:hypothetical protein